MFMIIHDIKDLSAIIMWLEEYIMVKHNLLMLVREPQFFFQLIIQGFSIQKEIKQIEIENTILIRIGDWIIFPYDDFFESLADTEQ